MKKVLLFVAVVSAISFTSCKKDYSCTCVTEEHEMSGVKVEAKTEVFDYPKTTKKLAEKSCDTQDDVSSMATCTFSED
jgi:hypothetical protein